MRYNVAQLLHEDVGARRVVEIGDARGTLDCLTLLEPLEGTVRLTRTNRGILATGVIETVVDSECSRCLEQTRVPLRVELAEEFFAVVDLRTGLPASREIDGEGFMLTEIHELDLEEPLRQGALVQMPMQPLCRDDCRGLCQQCGANLNEVSCPCAAVAVDPRLHDLARWLRNSGD